MDYSILYILHIISFYIIFSTVSRHVHTNDRKTTEKKMCFVPCNLFYHSLAEQWKQKYTHIQLLCVYSQYCCFMSQCAFSLSLAIILHRHRRMEMKYSFTTRLYLLFMFTMLEIKSKHPIQRTIFKANICVYSLYVLHATNYNANIPWKMSHMNRFVSALCARCTQIYFHLQNHTYTKWLQIHTQSQT